MTPAIRNALLVWLALMALLALTVAASFAPLGAFNPVSGMGIAAAKALLVFWFYMHLREEPGLLRLAALGAAAWLLILLALTATDFISRAWLRG